jgi:hypothetical protein
MELIWIESEGCWGKVLQRFPEFSIVKYYMDGIEYEEAIENSDLIELKEMGIDYESD